MAAHGVRPVYVHDDRAGDTLDAFIKALRPGDVAVVAWLYLLADRRGIARTKRRNLVEAMSRIEERATILELGSGLHSKSKKQRDDMIVAAYDMLTSGRHVSGRLSRGRPKQWQNAEERKIIWEEWHSSANPTNGHAADAASERIGRTVSANTMWRIVKEMRLEKGLSALGASGRKPGVAARRLAVMAPTKRNVPHVYFVQNGRSKRVKIGYSSHYRSRVGNIQSGTPDKLRLLGVVRGGKAVESELHKRFASYRISGEWFRFEGELAEYVQSLRKSDER